MKITFSKCLQIVTKQFMYMILLFGVFFSKSGYADCAQPQTPQEVLSCSLDLHPLVKQAEYRAIQAGKLEEVAKQRPNPDLESNTAFGRSDGQPVINSQTTLFHTFELGGKRSSRIEKAKAEKELITTEVLRAKEQVALTLVPALYRIRQIKVELNTLDEAISTFSKVQRLLKTRPRLTPDQEVSYSTFRLAESDYRLRKRLLEGEERSLGKIIGLPFDNKLRMSPEILPPPKEKWPELDESANGTSFFGSEMNRLRAEVRTAEADISLAHSSSWPNLRIGPTFQSQTQAGLSYQAYGFGLTLPLPIYQANGGGREYAHAGLSQAEVSLQSTSAQLMNERYRQIIEYQAALRAMQEAVTLHEMEKRHHQLDQLFSSGRIQATLVIEGHRQIVDLTRNLNEQELRAIQALWRTFVIEGRVLKEKL